MSTEEQAPRMIPLRAGFQNYPWGDEAFIPELFGFAPTGEPYAEAWLGAHQKLPSVATLPGGERSLAEVLAEHGNQLLGEVVNQLRPGVPVLYMSGLGSETRDWLSPEILDRCYIAKPFSREQLLETVRRCLKQSPPRSH